MKQFVFGTEMQFRELEKAMSNGVKYMFSHRQLPVSCQPKEATLWFAKIDGSFYVFIDKGIETSADHSDLRAFLGSGQMKFNDIRDMILFFHSLQKLYPNSHENITSNVNNSVGESELKVLSQPNEFASVVNKSEVKKLMDKSSQSKIVWPEELATPLKKQVYGQDRVIDELSTKIVINQLQKEKRLLVIALLGPTATGKSQTAKSLADVMSRAYGKNYGYIEIAGSELIGEQSVHRFFGAPPGYIGHGKDTILNPIRKNPNHIIVINEIEKADEKILVGLMEAVDTGYLGMADNSKPIDLNHCVMLFTSNIPINMDRYKDSSDFERSEMCRDAFTKHCGRPEISGKIGNFLVFNSLDIDARMDIISKFAAEALEAYDIRLKGIDKYLMAEFLSNETKYGARGIRQLVGDAIGKQLLKMRTLILYKNKNVIMEGTINDIVFKIVKE